MEKATPVLFYRFGEVNEATKSGAFVAESYNNGTLDLMLISAVGGDVQVRKGVPHISDPRLKDNVEFARYQGAWDYHPMFKPSKPKKAEAAVAPAPRNQPKDLDQRIVEYSETMSFDEVHRRVRMLGVSRDQLEEIYHKHDLVVKADA